MSKPNLRQIFDSLPYSKRTPIRQSIMEQAEISYVTFYNYIKGYTSPKPPVQLIFAKEFKMNVEELFPKTE